MILLLIKIQSSMLSLGMLIWAALPPTTIALLLQDVFFTGPPPKYLEYQTGPPQH